MHLSWSGKLVYPCGKHESSVQDVHSLRLGNSENVKIPTLAVVRVGVFRFRCLHLQNAVPLPHHHCPLAPCSIVLTALHIETPAINYIGGNKHWIVEFSKERIWSRLMYVETVFLFFCYCFIFQFFHFFYFGDPQFCEAELSLKIESRNSLSSCPPISLLILLALGYFA